MIFQVSSLKSQALPIIFYYQFFFYYYHAAFCNLHWPLRVKMKNLFDDLILR